MATLDDKLLGEKLHYYCSSSEDEGEDDKAGPNEPTGSLSGPIRGDGGATNTGPKGVLSDWQRYKQLETEQREEQAKEKLELAKRLTLSCRTDREDQEAKEKEEKLDQELDALLDDEFLQSYIKRRMQEMVETATTKKTFGQVFQLETGDDFLEAIDKEDKSVIIVIFIFEDKVTGCTAVKGCLQNIAPDYPHVKFCQIMATAAGLSRHFKASGVPAILAYKAGDLFASLIRITDSLGDDFYAPDLEGFLIEHAVLTDKALIPTLIRGPASHAGDDSD